MARWYRRLRRLITVYGLFICVVNCIWTCFFSEAARSKWGIVFWFLWLPLVPGFSFLLSAEFEGKLPGWGYGRRHSNGGISGWTSRSRCNFFFWPCSIFTTVESKRRTLEQKKKDVAVAPLWFVIVATAVAAVDSNRRPSDSRVA